MPEQPHVFEGIRVVEFASGIAAPYATMFLADHGAEVTRVEPPEGDPYRSEPGFLMLNRGKGSVVLDPSSEVDRGRLLALATSADVFVTSIDHFEARRLGIEASTLRAANPRLIYVSMPPYGERGPLVGRPSSPAAIAAVGGIMGGQASYGGEPVMPVTPVASYAAGVLGVGAIAAALYARERDGLGRTLEVSELAGALAMQLGTVTSDVVPDGVVQSPLLGSRGPVPPYALYEAGDGQWFFLACGTREFYDRMLVAIGRPELAADPRLQDAPWGLAGPEAHAALVPVLEETFRSAPRGHWLALFAKSDVPAQPVLTRDEYIASDFVQGNGLWATAAHPEHGRVEMPAVPVRIEAAPGSPGAPAPRLGQHTDAVLAGLASTAPAQTAPAADEGIAPRPLLEGVRVLDLASFIAGPSTARHLAMLGAEVVKVEPSEGDPFRVLNLGFQGWNLGKRSIGIDLRQPEGRALLDELLARTDVCIENYRAGAAQRLGLHYPSVAATHPELVYVEISGYGDAGGELPAFDPLLQALSGAMHAQGGDGEPVYSTVAITDLMTPLLAVFGACAALYHRQRTGAGGSLVRTSLAAAALAAQAGEFVRYEGRPTSRLAGGRDYRGPSAAERAYLTASGHYLLVEASTDEQRTALARAVAIEVDAAALAGSSDGPVAEALARVFRSRSLAEWVSALDFAHIPHAIVTPRMGLFNADHVNANRLVARGFHPVWGGMAAAGHLVHDAGVPEGPIRRAPMFSEQAVEILEDLGYDQHGHRRLVEAGVVAISRIDLPPEGVAHMLQSRTLARSEANRQLYIYFNMDVG